MARASLELHRIATDVAAIPDAGLIAAAKLVKKIALEEARATVSGGDLGGKHRKPIRLKARDQGIRTVTGGGRGILVQGTPAGPWIWMTSGTKPHTTRRRKRGPMKKMLVHHPGMRGKGAWDGVRKRSADLVPRIFQDLAREAI